MDWTAWGLGRPDWLFFARALNIILIDLILSGDNAVVIAMAVRSLPRRQRRWGIAAGAGAAVSLRVVLTFFAARLLEVQFLKLVGGALIAWIAVKLFLKGTVEERDQEAAGLLQAVLLILLADATMSLDNVLAIAAISRGNLILLIFGLIVSIPLVIFTSSLLSMLMDRYPIIVYLGSAILGRVAGEMIMNDPVVVHWLAPPLWLTHTVEAAAAVGVIVAGKLLVWLRFKRAEDPEAGQELSASPDDSLPARRPKGWGIWRS
jgi:YjbE family integral membrane protein|uniref:TerC family protein n=1 Tax=Desulfobacca acetoxidans TaxID=60893 RepID=A0A7V6A147_9BACT